MNAYSACSKKRNATSRQTNNSLYVSVTKWANIPHHITVIQTASADK